MIPELRSRFNQRFTPEGYRRLMELLGERCGVPVDYRVAETPIFVALSLLEEMAEAAKQLGYELTAVNA